MVSGVCEKLYGYFYTCITSRIYVTIFTVYKYHWSVVIRFILQLVQLQICYVSMNKKFQNADTGLTNTNLH